MRRALIFLFLSVVLISYTLPSHAEEGVMSVSLRVCFRRNSSMVDPGYLNNKQELDKFVSEVREIMFDSTAQIQEIHIRSGASPEGQFDNNQELSLMRGLNLKNHLQDALSLPSDMFVVEAVGEDWMALKDMVAKNNVPDKKMILAILNKYDKYIKSKPTTVLGGPKKELMDLNGGRTWNWLLENIFPELRSAGNYTVCQYTRIQEPAKAVQPSKKRHSCDTLVVIHKHIIEVDTAKLTDTILKMELAVPSSASVADPNHTKITPKPGDSIQNGALDSSLIPDSVKEYELKPIFTLRSNLLLPLMNVGAQIPLGNRFSIGLDWYYPFIHRHWAPFLDQTNCFQALGPGADFRIYLGKKHRKGRENWQYRFSGHSIGIYGMYGRYDVEWQFDGEQAPFWCAGLDYMYSARIGKRKRMRLDLSLGVGYFTSRGTKYHVFRPGGLAYRTGRILEYNWIGPNKATISLVIPIYTKIRKKAVNE